jgi:hypothetical protein
MKRVLGILAGMSLALAIGCAQSYDLRVEETIKNMRYRRDLDKNTEAPPTKSNLENAKIYLRAPKGFKGPADTFAPVPDIDKGKFDIADSFFDQGKRASLHILARTNAPKAPTKKGPNPPGAAEQPATAVRGDFTADVLDLIKGAYNTDIESAQLKPTEPNAHGRKSITYKSATLDLNDKQLKIYFHGDKNGPAQVALIFEGPKEALHDLVTQIDYSLNSLVLGPRASSFYSGQDELAGEEGPAAPPGGVF